jgi:hypothetical protein
MNLPATNNARFDHLIGLARQLEENSWRYRNREKALKLAAVYRDMAFQVMPSEAAVAELNLTERARLAAKLRQMTVGNGCTVAEADNAAQLLLKLEGGR